MTRAHLIRALIAAAVLLLPGAAFAQTAPRDTVTAIAAQIRDRYFSVERGDAIADALEAEAAEGRYDALTDPRDLASALSSRLRPEDAHFNVAWEAESGATGGGGPGGPHPRGGPDPQRLSNYGFSRVEILHGNIGLIEMRSFANIDFSDPADPARRAADAALDLVANADAVIFDLRNNGGGAPSMVGYLVSAFTPADAPIYNVFHSREGTDREAPAVFHRAPRLEVPVYVLTSGRTGSAGEAFPYTLQAADRAVIVGEATGGAANPGGMVPIPGGFRVFISGGSPINPITGGNWEGTGVVPDIEVPAAQARDHAVILALQTPAADPARTDAVWALEAMQAAARPAEAIALADYAGAYGALAIAVEDGRLEARRGRRPPLVLAQLAPDQFYVLSDPLMRFIFERDGAGSIIALEQHLAFGGSQRLRRE